MTHLPSPGGFELSPPPAFDPGAIAGAAAAAAAAASIPSSSDETVSTVWQAIAWIAAGLVAFFIFVSWATRFR